MTRTRGNGFPVPEGRVRGDIGKKSIPGRVGRPWHRAAVAAPGSLEVPKARLDLEPWSSLGQWKGLEIDDL